MIIGGAALVAVAAAVLLLGGGKDKAAGGPAGGPRGGAMSANVPVVKAVNPTRGLHIPIKAVSLQRFYKKQQG